MRLPQSSFNMAIRDAVTSVGGIVKVTPRDVENGFDLPDPARLSELELSIVE